jgi:hypothetical protein
MRFIVTFGIMNSGRSARRNIVVCQQLQQVQDNQKPKFTIATITNRKSMAEEAIVIKKEGLPLLRQT